MRRTKARELPKDLPLTRILPRAVRNAGGSFQLAGLPPEVSYKGLEGVLGSPRPLTMSRSFLEADVEQVVQQLSIDEKVRLLSGKDHWRTSDIPRLGIPS